VDRPLPARLPTPVIEHSGDHAGAHHRDRFVAVRGTQFVLDNHPYHFVGANYWQAMNLASRGPGGTAVSSCTSWTR
jgi:hypothetical protein